MEESNSTKIQRVLEIYAMLSEGKIVNKSAEAVMYGVNERSIQRDVNDIRDFLELRAGKTGTVNSIVYDRAKKGYRMETIFCSQLSAPEVLVICKILLDSRAFVKEELAQMIDRLIECCVSEKEQKIVRDLINNEEFHYVEPRHKTRLLERVWQIGQVIRGCNYIQLDYKKDEKETIVVEKVKPVAIIFSEYYFYLAAFIHEEGSYKGTDEKSKSLPVIYRIDRIEQLKVLDEHFHVAYNNRFEEGEFRKQMQVMHGERPQRVKFKYFGTDIDTILDRIPTAKILDKKDGVYIVSAEMFGKGIDMWLESQGNVIEKVDKSKTGETY